MSYYDNEDAGDLRSAHDAGYSESLTEGGLSQCSACGRLYSIRLEECPECFAGEELGDGGCYGCKVQEPVTVFMEQAVCWACYNALAYNHYTADRCEFADPGSESALRAAGPGNPRVYACPTCKDPGVLTGQDLERGYQCDRCARAAERGFAFDEC